MVDGAKESYPLLMTMLGTAGVLITILAAIAWKLIQDRVVAARLEDEVLRKKLAAGSDRMAEHDKRIESKVDKGDCERYRCEMDKRIEMVAQDVRHSTIEIRDCMHAIERRMEQLHASHEVAIRLLRDGAHVPGPEGAG